MQPPVPTPLPAALDLLLASEARVSTLVQPAFGLSSDNQAEGSSSSSSSERSQKRAVRMRYDLNNARCLLEQLRRVLVDRFDGIPAQRRELVLVRQVAAVLGAGAMVFNCLEKPLRELKTWYDVESQWGENGLDVKAVKWARHETRGEVWDMMRGLKDLGTAVWFVLTILESPSDDDVATNRENLRTAVAEIMGKDNALSREIKRLYPEPEAGLPPSNEAVNPGSSTEIRIYHPPSPSDSVAIVCEDDSDDSDSEDGPPTPSSSVFPFPDTVLEGHLATLANISALDDVLIPIAPPETSEPDEPTPPQRDSNPLKVITVSTSGVDISPLPSDLDTSLSQPTPDTALSADAVFQLPDVTDTIVLDFFRRALQVSRFALGFPRGQPRLGYPVHCAAQGRKLETLRPRQMRELCTDLYDELVRRNVEDQNRNRRESASSPVEFVEPEGLDVKRMLARAKLARMRDAPFGRFMRGVLLELERRSQTCLPAEEEEDVESAAAGLAKLSAVQGDRWSVEAVWKAPVWEPGSFIEKTARAMV
ncbi:hypothetical protein C8A00DRAFT_17832 [Chaetomidium leptoderma]|uniref:GIT Spa2 homology (SHD) domain-containing protein n=1 Tax=Chaetomidium leptoderma TaxID=669021 RepID=A0AAN6VFW0_9PEZI|nr:hypothetical protein C8A00DRAFT_17832 [Chaetomidium leptoderma]